jgi:chromosomal replication initiation ATPase DnaA
MNDQRSRLVTLFGQNGSGKTRRLMEMEKRTTCGQVLRIGAETLIEDIVAGARHGLATNTLICYRKIDNLLIDNLWVLASRPYVSRLVRELVSARRSDGLLTVLASDMTLAQWSVEQAEMASLLASGETVQF